MAGYVSLPAYQVPRNAMLDFSGLNAGIDAIAERNQNAMNRAERAEERTYQRGRNAVADSREQTRFNNQQDDRARNNFDDTVKRVAGFAQDHVLSEKDPARRAAKWQQLLDSHPDLKGAPDAYRDPTSGPELFVSQARGYMDPLERQLKEAQISKMQREAQAGPGATKYGKSGAVFQGPDGSFYTMQFAEDGTRSIQPVQVPGQNGAPPTALTPARGVDVVGDEMFSRSTGAPVRNVGDNIQRAEFAKGRGQNDADFIAKYPKVQGSYKSFEQKTGNLIGYADQQGKQVQGVIDRAIASVGPNTSGWQGVLRSLPASAARNLENDLKTIQANIAFGELQDMRANSPTGGALGAVTERELDLLSSVQASLDQLQEGVRLKENLGVVKRNLLEIQRLRREAFELDQQRYRSLSSGQVPNPDGGGAALQGGGGPPVGTMQDGYRFKGGNPGDPNSWERM